jgi:hypothetical protein
MPRFLGKNDHHSRPHAKAVEMDKIVDNIEKTRLFGESPRFQKIHVS